LDHLLTKERIDGASKNNVRWVALEEYVLSVEVWMAAKGGIESVEQRSGLHDRKHYPGRKDGERQSQTAGVGNPERKWTRHKHLVPQDRFPQNTSLTREHKEYRRHPSLQLASDFPALKLSETMK
jgi:hypothetical protein